MIEARSISKTFGNLNVVNSVDLNIAKGEVVSIVGPSGAGKSTLLHILGTIDKPTAGSLTINDKDILSLNSKELAAFRNKNIGFIFQFHHLLAEFTARENIIMPSLIAGKRPSDVTSRAVELLEYMGIQHRQDHKPGEMSGGEQQRVAVARALMNSPLLVLADEPTGNLDSQNAKELHELFFNLRDEFNQTFVIVTHNEELAERADRKISMRDGMLLNEKATSV